jgi:hypothetical protein
MTVHPLPVPPAAAADPAARELIRVWAAGGKQHITLASEVWDDPVAWGMPLVDLAHHIANAYAPTRQHDRTACLARIKAGFDAEWNKPTDIARRDLLE